MDFDLLAPDAPSRDHVVPRSRLKGMKVDESFYGSNIKLAHRFCNSHRQSRAIRDTDREEYVTRLAEAMEEYDIEQEAREGIVQQE